MKMQSVRLLVAVLVCAVVLCVRAAGMEFQNYDNDPTLAKAWQYDSEHATDKSKVDRDKAVEYYLKYLEREDLPSFQRAKVYVQLAVQYTTLSDREKGIMPDVEKARGYLEKALELEPERVGLTTVRARSFLASVLQTREEKITKRMENYEWLLSLDQAKVEELALPIAPGDAGRLEKRFPEILNYAQGVGKTTAVNIIASVRMMPDKEVWLGRIIERFPNAEIAEMARKELLSLGDKASEANTQPAAEGTYATATSTASDQNAPAVKELGQANAAVEASVSSAPDSGSGRSGSLYLWVGAGALLVVVVGGVLAKMAASHR